MSRKERRKGYRGEHQLVKKLKKAGINAVRVPLSGASEGFKGDVIVEINGEKFTAEVKLRKTGFKQLYTWLSGKDILFVKADRKEYLAVLPLETLIKLLRR